MKANYYLKHWRIKTKYSMVHFGDNFSILFVCIAEPRNLVNSYVNMNNKSDVRTFDVWCFFLDVFTFRQYLVHLRS